ncbi:MAG: 4Fe-4S ferredoxin, partial [Thermoplasmatales archaeon]
YDERKTMENIVKAGKNTVIAHLRHLKEHGETGYLKEALEVLEEKGIEVNLDEETDDSSTHQACVCPGAKVMDFSHEHEKEESRSRGSQLRQWPVQLHLVPPNAPYFTGKDVLLVADCVAYALADFHKDYLKGKSLAIACPKLDSNLDIYIDKLAELIDTANINTITVMTMEVPCCSGLLGLAQKASEKASRKIPIKSIVVGIKGEVLKEEWL